MVSKRLSLSVIFLAFEFVCGPTPCHAQATPGTTPAVMSKPQREDPAKVFIGALAAQSLIATNTNVGLAVELCDFQIGNPKIIIDVMKQTVRSVDTSVKFLEDYTKKVKLTKEDAELMTGLLDAFRSVPRKPSPSKMTSKNRTKKTRRTTFGTAKKWQRF